MRIMRINYAHSREAMKRKSFREEPDRFRHSGRIGQAPKPGRKRAVNVTVDEHILADAKELGLNLSQVLEDELRRRVTEERTRRWQEEHREAIDAHNRFVEKHGIFGAKYRSW
jgi:antitoxin CcdA